MLFGKLDSQRYKQHQQLKPCYLSVGQQHLEAPGVA